MSILLSCKKDESIIKEEVFRVAEVIAFHPEKCGCCWGWEIRMETDTIMTESANVGELTGIEIANPIPVRLELGAKQQCSKYYDILKIVRVEK